MKENSPHIIMVMSWVPDAIVNHPQCPARCLEALSPACSCETMFSLRNAASKSAWSGLRAFAVFGKLLSRAGHCHYGDEDIGGSARSSTCTSCLARVQQHTPC